jgi:hypothetical protein
MLLPFCDAQDGFVMAEKLIGVRTGRGDLTRQAGVGLSGYGTQACSLEGFRRMQAKEDTAEQRSTTIAHYVNSVPH